MEEEYQVGVEGEQWGAVRVEATEDVVVLDDYAILPLAGKFVIAMRVGKGQGGQFHRQPGLH